LLRLDPSGLNPIPRQFSLAHSPREDRFEAYIIKNFITEVDTHYRTIREQYARAVAGLSMGGYGAIKFALKYP
jgi:S-formylglutathione hydrolase FrmB